MDDNSLVPRPGPTPRVSEGPKVGQTSLYRQRVLDEDTYTEALSEIITRDFFPDLPQIHATNSYLSALTNNDPELLSSSIRRLAALAREEKAAIDDFSVTPSIRPSRTPLGGGRDWDTPQRIEAGPSRKKPKLVRDDLSLDAFQRNYTSEDNASFSQIVDDENRKRREERWGWAWEAEKKAEQRRLESEERRKMILDTAISGQWRVNAEGKRLTGALSEGGREKDVGEAWKEPLRIEDDIDLEATKGDQSRALITGDQAAKEHQLPPSHPLSQALLSAGLPATAMVSEGAIVPHVASEPSRKVMDDERPEYLSSGGSGTELWGFKTRNNFYFPADANEDPYPKTNTQLRKSRQLPPSISHDNTRLPDKEDDVPRSQRGSSPSSSVVDRAVRGEGMPTINSYPLLPTDPSPSPQDLPSLLTWGSLAATPRALDSDDPLETGPSFRMPETKRRDDIARRLADRAKQSMNQRAQGFTPRSGLASALRSAAERTQRSVRGDARDMLPPGTPRRDSLTPAGKRLLENTLGRRPGTSSMNRSAAMEKAAGWGDHKARNLTWTPSPRR